MQNISASSFAAVRVESFTGKGGKIMGVFRLDDPRRYKRNGVSVAMPIENAKRLAKRLAKERDAILSIDDVRCATGAVALSTSISPYWPRATSKSAPL